jgi:hypothetical protein
MSSFDPAQESTFELAFWAPDERPWDCGSRSQREENESMDTALCRIVQQLPRSTVAMLKTKYRELFGEELPPAHKQFLIRRIAWRLQALAEGDLSERARQRAAEIVEDADLDLRLSKPSTTATVPAAFSPVEWSARDRRLPQPGSLLQRAYQGREIVVKVLEQGFEYEAKPYRSLSAIARHVTGTRWNGLLFFGLTDRRNG